MEKQYYWAENLEDYQSDNLIDEAAKNPVIEIKRLNFFIGKNNAGKSRFLRNLFSSKISIPNCNSEVTYLQIYEMAEYLNSLNDEVIELHKASIHSLIKRMEFIPPMQMQMPSKYFFEQLNKLENELISYTKLQSLLQDKTFVSVNISAILELYNFSLSILRENFNQPTTQLSSGDKLIDRLISKYIEILHPYSISTHISPKFYIPILRGMRPIHGNNFPYRKRTEHDYFGDENHENDVITGESLFQELTEHLLGEPEQRQLIADYQKLLSQYFFDNQEITLIPKHGTDVVHIKIGNEPQFPIYQLGDGLQQAIILTYPVFLNNQDAHMFFIEEPELHMHAGMVRQLMNFYLNETKHYYFFTTHSNHLLDMADESDEVIIQKFVKQSDEQHKTSFQIYRCDRDRDLLASLGVKPSSVYLANCTIWVEGITDRLYLLKYMEKYLQELQNEQPEKYLQYRRFMPNYHYAFVEYSGGNIVHWDFSDDFADGLADKGLSAKAIVSYMLLIADGDNRDKAARLFEWNEELGAQNVVVLESKEMENTLPFDVIMEVAKARFMRMQAETKMGFEIEKLDLLDKRDYFVHKTKGIGFLLDKQIRLPETDKKKSVFADGGVGTIKDKLKFCREVIQYFDNNPDWELTAEARELCERIFQHIYDANKCQTEPKT